MKTKFTDQFFERQINTKNAGSIKAGATSQTEFVEITGNYDDTRTTTYNECGEVVSVVDEVC